LPPRSATRRRPRPRCAAFPRSRSSTTSRCGTSTRRSARSRQPQPHVGFLFSNAAARTGVYAEFGIRRDLLGGERDRDEAFGDLDFAFYFGRSEREDDLLFTSVDDLPIDGRLEVRRIDIGDATVTLVATPRGYLGNSFTARLPWLILGIGLLLTLGAGAMTERLARRRERAEDLASENQRLYGEQRSIAATLQRSLLPGELPQLPGLEVAARYLAGAEGVDIGGDWYDVMVLDERRVLVAMGDVSGRGLHAATIMASLRFAIRAYAAQGDSPAALLAKLSDLVNVNRDGHFATVLCAVIDTTRGEMTFASAGHPPPLLVDRESAEFVATANGVPVGVPSEDPYQSVTIAVRPGMTLLAFTDGLVERRREDLTVGFARLREAAAGPHETLDDLLDRVVGSLLPGGGSHDDTALLGVRWHA
jgi:serine phosphatase RsbU (regulator of sigma subunit)